MKLSRNRLSSPPIRSRTSISTEFDQRACRDAVGSFSVLGYQSFGTVRSVRVVARRFSEIPVALLSIGVPSLLPMPATSLTAWQNDLASLTSSRYHPPPLASVAHPLQVWFGGRSHTMSRWLALFIVALCLAGCRAPRPCLDPFAGYGNQCVPAPQTGSIGYGSGYYQAQAGQLYGPSARAMHPVPTLGNAPSQLRTSQVPQLMPDDNTGAAYQPPRPSNTTVANLASENVQDNQLTWIAPYANGPDRAAAVQYSAPPYYSQPYRQPEYAPPYVQPSYPTQQLDPSIASVPANRPPMLGSQPSVGLIPPMNQVPGTFQYSSPLIPSFARSSAGCCGPNPDTSYSALEPAPQGSVVTYEAPYAATYADGYGVPSYGPPLVSGTRDYGYRTADDGWQARAADRR